jgi:3-hydroxyisobutyrate dehydrogenase-like beta-hydroxyacid dehydrogenase
MTRPGFVGLGKMGQPMATNICASGHDVICFDAAGTDARLPSGATAAASVQDVAAAADVVLLSVPDGRASVEIAQRLATAPERRATVVVDLSTIGPQAAQEAAGILASVNVEYCDGPVSGGVAGARARTISLMFSGSEARLTELRSLLESFAGNVFHVGHAPGQGQAMKLVNNFLSATALAATSEALALGLSYGLDMTTMIDVLNVSTGRNSATVDKFPNRIVPATYDAGFSTAHMTKDVGLFLEAAEQAATESSIASAVTAAWRSTLRAMPESDFTEIWRHLGEGVGRDRSGK